MADDEQSLGDDEQSFLLSETSSLDGVDFRAASGIDAGNPGRSIIGTIGFALATAARIFFQGVTEAWTRLIDGLAGFLAGGRQIAGVASRLAREPIYRDVQGLIGTLANNWVSAMEGAWSSALPDAGIAAWLFALGIVLVTFYAAARGFDTVSEVIRG